MSVPMDRVAIISKMAERRMTCDQLVELSGVSRVTVTAVRSGKSVNADLKL